MTTLKLLAVDLLDTIKPFVQLIGDGLKGALEGTAGATDKLAEGLGGILQAAITLLMALIEAIPTIITFLVKELPKITRSITETLLTRLPDIIEAAIELFMGILEAIPEIVTELIKNMPEIISAIVEGLASGADALADAGLDLLKGIWKGIKDGAGWLKDKIFGFAGNVADWFKEKFEINSPSKVMADDVGEYIGEGIGVGVVDSIPKVKKQLGKFAGFVQDNLSSIKSGLDINANGSGTGFATGRGNTVVNAGMTVNYNGRLSRKALRKMENEQYSAIKRRLIAEGAI